MQAEARLEKTSRTVENLSLPEIKALIHDYQVHQIELEIQNEELRETQKQLELARDRYARLFNDAPVGYLTIDETGIIAQTNETFAAMVGREPSYLSGKALVDFIDSADRSAFYGRFKAFFKNPQGKHLDFRLYGKGGSPAVRCVGRMEKEIHVQPEQNARQHLLLILTDISAQVRAEEALRESEERNRLLSDVTLEGIVIHKNGVARDLNPAMTKLFGYNREELLGVNILELLIHEEDQDIVHSNIVKEYAQPYSIRAVKKSGEFFHAELEARNFETRGEILRVAAVRDISDRKLAEQELAKINEQLQRAIAEKDTFFSIIAHDLKSPISAFTALTKQLLDDGINWTMEDIQTATAILHKSALRLADLLENLLNWAQMQRGLVAYEPMPCRLGDIVRQNVGFLHSIADQKEIMLHNEIADDILVHVDPPMISTVVRNLLSNALKFTRRGGNVWISAERQGAVVKVAVKDDGMGMDENMVSKLFMLNQNIMRLGTEGERPTGLGLILCKEFITKHGCDIWVESKAENGGTTFHFTLPAARSNH
nr:PAS domain S-box protein [Desulfonatronum thiosulfatophilum]